MSTNQRDTLLVELGTEELPPKSLKVLSDSFAQGLKNELDKLGFEYSHCTTFGAPRRLAVAFNDCQRTQADKQVEKRGPAVSAAFNEQGEPTPAALGWARGNGISIEQAERLVTDKGEWLLHKATVPGQNLDSQLQAALERTIKQLPIPKPMRWGNNTSEFIRPVHTLTVMYGSEVLAINLLGLSSSNQVSGHRFHGDHRTILDHANSYAELMRSQYVLVDYQSRMQAIEEQLISQSTALGLTPSYDAALLEEISSLVEWPVVLQAKFEDAFLGVPKEALIYTMKDDQKYVPLLDADGELSSTFLFVTNIESKDAQQIIDGNEKVIRPRLSDAKFFFDTDKKTTLASKANKLSSILFQKELGTVAEKSERVSKITQVIGRLINASEQELADAKRAANLAKADLVSNMVMEFPSVQGVMGYHYALHDGENEAVATAIKEQYLPRFAGDELPQTTAGMLVSLGEKLDTLVGIFGINKLPKGDKDPFALRRSAIGILRILLNFNVNVGLGQIVEQVAALFGSKLSNDKVESQVVSFLLDRLKPFYADKDISGDVISAVLACETEQSLSDINQRVLAVAEFARSSSAESLVNANKRVSNILAKNKISLDELADVNPSLFEQDEESALFASYSSIATAIPALAAKNDYSAVLAQLSTMKEPLDAFFDKVMIMADNDAVKANRIALASHVRKQFLSVADISVLNI
ncbi:glycine--tRNA ligase subunit beta [Glaciecola sp. 2405UD65-10]|uniref:glycine--tRNA ligase subunit beta n=1 Tax=Glaciecola sp. 2405UD65-10 TaxID=3397244 RepID=UPI003B5A1F91